MQCLCSVVVQKIHFSFSSFTSANCLFNIAILVAYFSIHRSSHKRCSITIGVLKKFAIFTGRHLCQSLFFNKVAGLEALSTEHLRETASDIFLYKESHGINEIVHLKFVKSVTSWKRSEFGVFLIRIFSYSIQIWENTDRKKYQIWTLLTQCI